MKNEMTTLREDIRAALVCATFAKENRNEDNSINWDFVDSDVCIEFGKRDTGTDQGIFFLISEIMNELAEEIITAKINDKISKLNTKLNYEKTTKLADDLLGVFA